MPDNLPDYDDLPEVEGGARSGWHLFGVADSFGLMNLQTPETRGLIGSPPNAIAIK